MNRTVPLGVTLFLLLVLLTTALPTQAASVSLREGLYVEEVEGDLDGAIKIYQQVIEDETSPKNMVAQALYHQGMCYLKQKKESEAKAAFGKLIADHADQTDLIAKVKPLLEELGNADPAALMPPETIAYLEIGSPGKQIETILKMLEGTPFENPLAMIQDGQGQEQWVSQTGFHANIVGALLNPSMMAEFRKIRGMGIGLTGIGPDNPPFVLVMFPGKSDALRGILQMILGVVGRPADAVEGMQCVTISNTVAAAYDENVVILAQGPNSMEQLQWSARQHQSLASRPTLASSNESFTTINKKARQDNALTVWINADEAYGGLLKMFPGEVPMQIQMANGMVNFAGIDDLIASLSLKQTSVTLEANVNFKEGYQSMAYGMARTPNLDRAAFKAVPPDAIAVVSIGVGDADAPQAQMASQQISVALGLDIGRDLFDNIEQITLFVMPFHSPTEQPSDDMPPQVKSIGLAITSSAPQKTYELLGTVLRTTNLAVAEQAPAGGRYAFTLPNQESIFGYMDQDARTTVLSLNADLIEKSIATIEQSSATAKSGPLVDALQRLPETTNKLVMINAAGLFEFVGQSMELPEGDEIADQIHSAIGQLAQASRKTTVELRTSEQARSLRARLAVNNLPPIGEVLGPIMQIAQFMERLDHQAGSWAVSTTPPMTILGTDTAPTIDGQIDACWAKVQALEVANSLYDPASSPEDCTATFKTLWDENSLYVLVDVADDDLQNDSEEFWLDDGVEIFLDADNSKSGSYGDNDYQYFFGWDASSPTMGKGGNEQDDGTKYAFAKTNKGYRLEVQFAWSTLGAQAKPGTNIGLDVQVNDDDGGGQRDSKIAWNAVQDDAWQNPGAFGTAQLAGLIAWWKLDEAEGDGVSDASGNGRGGTLAGDPQWLPAGGKVGGALKLDGRDDYVETGYVNDLPAWTVAAWVKSPAAPASTDPSGPVHREKNYQINWNHLVDEFRGATAVCVDGTWYGAGFGHLQADTWYHLVGTYDGENLKAYKNGVLVTDNADPSGAPDSEQETLKLGCHAAQRDGFEGTIDEVRLYNYALEQADVAALAGGQ